MAAGEGLGLLTNNIAVRSALQPVCAAQASCFAAIGLFMQMRLIQGRALKPGSAICILPVGRALGRAVQPCRRLVCPLPP